MPRKLHVAIRSWLPEIIRCHFEREPFSLLEILKQVDGRLIGLTSEEQFAEIVLVFDHLVESGYLTKKDGEKAYYGNEFKNVLYYPVQPKFDEIIQQITEQRPSSEQIKDRVVVNVTINNKVSWLNVEKIFDKLLNVDARLF